MYDLEKRRIRSGVFELSRVSLLMIESAVMSSRGKDRGPSRFSILCGSNGVKIFKDNQTEAAVQQSSKREMRGRGCFRFGCRDEKRGSYIILSCFHSIPTIC